MAFATIQANVDAKIPIFMGPAGEKFDSIQQQANYFLNTYWSNWKNYENPQSYMIPPTFKYKRSEVSDRNFENFCQNQIGKRTRIVHELISDRKADEAEFMMYNAIQKLIDDEIYAPFIAIRNLNLYLNFDAKKDQLRGFLTEIFPNVNWNKFHDILKKSNAEYDFLLIGPKIGIVVIEVKSSEFRQHFNEERNFLPNDYKDGLKQLESVRGLIYLLQECTRMEWPNKNCVRQILFTPNLEKRKYAQWLARLTKSEQQRVQKKISSTIQWFKEDAKNLSCLLRNNFRNGSSISNKLYEKYTPILAAMVSIISMSTLELNKLNFSGYETALKENERLIEHNPILNKKNRKISASSLLQKAPKEVQKYSNVFFLTLEQQNAFYGPAYQFILGAAGTGKTIVLQSKACELLARNKSVVVLSTASYMWRYKNLFDNYGFTNYKIYDLSIKTGQIEHQFRNYLSNSRETIKTYDDLIKIIDYFINRELENPVSNFMADFQFLADFDNILIDDAFDWLYYFIHYTPFLIMRYIQNVTRMKKNHCWIAIDPCRRNDIYDMLPKSDHPIYKYRESVVVLRQVMRCSEEIYINAYTPALVEQNFPIEIMPVLGHKIKGSKVIKIIEHFTTFRTALAILWTKIQTEIQLLIDNKIDLKNIVIIICDDWFLEEINCKQFLRDKCKEQWPNLICAYDHFYDCQIEMTSKTNLINGTNNLLLITPFAFVSSLEWPVVITINILSMDIKSTNVSEYYYFKYRAMSRATAKLIDITFTCEEAVKKYVALNLSELDLLINLFKNNNNLIKHTLKASTMEDYQTNFEEMQAWKNVCNKFNDSVPSGSRRTFYQIKEEIRRIYNQCSSYANNYNTSPKPAKPRYFEVFNDIYAFVSNDNTTTFIKRDDDEKQLAIIPFIQES